MLRVNDLTQTDKEDINPRYVLTLKKKLKKLKREAEIVRKVKIPTRRTKHQHIDRMLTV